MVTPLVLSLGPFTTPSRIAFLNATVGKFTSSPMSLTVVIPMSSKYWAYFKQSKALPQAVFIISPTYSFPICRCTWASISPGSSVFPFRSSVSYSPSAKEPQGRILLILLFSSITSAFFKSVPSVSSGTRLQFLNTNITNLLLSALILTFSLHASFSLLKQPAL